MKYNRIYIFFIYITVTVVKIFLFLILDVMYSFFSLFLFWIGLLFRLKFFDNNLWLELKVDYFLPFFWHVIEGMNFESLAPASAAPAVHQVENFQKPREIWKKKKKKT